MEPVLNSIFEIEKILEISEYYVGKIVQKYRDLLNSKPKNQLNNYELAKIFEWWSCIKLMEEFKTVFLEYGDIPPDFKEEHYMSKNDTGIDLCNMIDSIVQCKLREKQLSWKECSTFFASQNSVNSRD